MTSLDPLIRLVGRPILLLSYVLFTREIRRAPMPRDECELVFVAIPPLADFWRIASPARQLIRHQTNLLNAATRRAVERIPGARYSPFPDLEGPAQAPGAVSWRQLHDEWARRLAPIVVEALESRVRG